jgi:Putative auto-transporter adhesin, head GIN domain
MRLALHFLYLPKLSAMKHILILLFTIFTLASCNNTTGSGNIVTENRKTGSFDAISVGGSFDVEVKMGDALSVTVEADDNIMKYIETRVSGNTLKIETEGLHNYSDVHMKVYVTVTSLTRISASASAEVIAENILTSSSKLVFKASSSASIKAEVNAPEVETDANSSATITLTGKTKNHKTEASSSAEIKTFELLSENTTAHASSSANIEVHASVNLDAKASSSGSIEYKGAAIVTKSESSSGSVEKKD